jgi:hypothetical protein
MLADTNERPGIAELYECAALTSDLTVTTRQRGAADIIMAVAISQTELARHLRRLAGSWASRKPRKFTEADVDRHAASLPAKGGKPDVKRARTELLLGYRAAVRRTTERLPGFNETASALAEWAARKGHDPQPAAAALSWWIAQGCVVCDGAGKRKLPDAPVLGKTCNHCNGTGKAVRPLGAAKILDYIEEAVNDGQQKARGLLRNS